MGADTRRKMIEILYIEELQLKIFSVVKIFEWCGEFLTQNSYSYSPRKYSEEFKAFPPSPDPQNSLICGSRKPQRELSNMNDQRRHEKTLHAQNSNIPDP